MINISGMQKFFYVRCSCLVGNKLYFMYTNLNAFCCLDITTNCIKYICEIKGEAPKGEQLYSDIILYKNKLIFVPLNAKEIAVFDLASKKITKVSLREIEIINSNNSGSIFYNEFSTSKFCTAVIINSKLYFIAQRYPAIIEFNPETLKTDYYIEWVDKITKFQTNNFAYFREDVVVKGDYIFCKSINSQAVLKFNTKDKDFTIINKENFMSVNYENMNEVEKDILLSNVKESTFIKEYKELYLKSTIYKVFSGKFIELEKYLYYIPWRFNVLIRYEKETGKKDKVTLCSKNTFFFEYNENLFGLDLKKYILLNLGCDGSSIKESVVKFNSDGILLKKMHDWFLNCYEGETDFNLKDFLNIIITENDIADTKADHMNIGKMIYQESLKFIKNSKEV